MTFIHIVSADIQSGDSSSYKKRNDVNCTLFTYQNRGLYLLCMRYTVLASNEERSKGIHLKCDICLSHQSVLGSEPILQHDKIEHPWAEIGVDLCKLNGHILLVVCDYYSNFIEIDNINKATSQTVSKSLKGMFSRY